MKKELLKQNSDKKRSFGKEHRDLAEIIDDERIALVKSGGKVKGRVACGFHKVEICNLNVSDGSTKILENLNLSIYCGKLTVIIGKNGAGKSTLIKCILGERSYTGSITFRDLKNNTMSKLKVGYVPQKLDIEPNCPITVYDMVAGYISRIPIFLVKSRKLYERIKSKLAVFDAEELIDKRVCDLSGGELQRVMLTIACTPVPDLLLLDEPVSGIDKNGRELFYKTLDNLKKASELSIILVSHDLELTKEYADNVVLVDGTVLSDGTPSEVMESDAFKQVFGVGISKGQ